MLDAAQVLADESGVGWFAAVVFPRGDVQDGGGSGRASFSDVLGGSLPPHQTLEEGCAGQAIGSVKAGARHLAHGIEIVDGGPPHLVGPNPAAGVVGRRHHRDQIGGDIDPVGEPGLINVGEALPDPIGRDEGAEVQVDVGHVPLQHLGVDAPGHQVPGCEVLPLRAVLLHERLAVGMDQSGPGPTNGLGDEGVRGVGVVEGGGVELDELGIDDPGPGPVRHGQTVSSSSGGIRGPEEDLAQAAGGKDGLLCLVTAHPPFLLIQDIGSHARKRVVHGQPVSGVVRGGEEIDGRVLREDGDVGVGRHQLLKGDLHGLSGGIGGVDNSGKGVASSWTRDRDPSSFRSKSTRALSMRSSSKRRGPSSERIFTAVGLQCPPPACVMSRARRSGESPSP